MPGDRLPWRKKYLPPFGQMRERYNRSRTPTSIVADAIASDIKKLSLHVSQEFLFDIAPYTV